MSAHRTLGVSPTASPEEIKAAYRKLALRYHPDMKGGDARRMSRINAAYAQLTKTKAVDDEGSYLVIHFEGNASVEAVFRNLASALFGGGLGEFFEEAARMKEAEQRSARQRPHGPKNAKRNSKAGRMGRK